MTSVPVPHGSDFGIDNLAYGVIAPGDGPPRVGVRIGDDVLDLDAIGADRLGVPADALRAPSLNALMALGPPAWSRLRAHVRALVTDDTGDELMRALHPLGDCTVLLPIDVGDYVDFNSSLAHATNLGRILRPGTDPLLANWRHLPAGYTGRAGSIVVSGTPVTRPVGLRPGSDGPTFGPTTMLDFELEVGFVVGASGTRIRPDDADHHVFGAVLLNDWSARDIQAFEYQPLGPHLGKSFATTVSPWVVPLDALRPFFVAPPRQDPTPHRYLHATRSWGLDLELRVSLCGTVVCATNLRNLYWTFAQQLAHLTVNGAVARTGDLFASGTVSGTDPGEQGCLMEITRGGVEPLTLADGQRRTFLDDGDAVTMRGWCGTGRTRVGFGDCTGIVEPAQGG